MKNTIQICAVLALLVVSKGSDAHHSFAAEFDYDDLGTIEGEVIEALFVNPHVRYFIAVVDQDGNETTWDAQTRSVSALVRVGWDKDTIKTGDRVKLYGNFGLDGARKIWIREVTRADGSVVSPTGE
jgi:hypothetical protein